MCGELMDNEQGGREYEADMMARAKREWMDETNGEVSFDDWLDGNYEPEEE